MKQALIVVNEIQAINEQIRANRSAKRTADLRKYRNELIEELKEYCGYRNIDFDLLRSMWERRGKRGKRQ